ncbi:MAG: hypothetical protein J6Y37_09885 [Paludibacteraceae bacterium]|nr:hypothetical protein [Paludibacteraceae bacterium]
MERVKSTIRETIGELSGKDNAMSRLRTNICDRYGFTMEGDRITGDVDTVDGKSVKLDVHVIHKPLVNYYTEKGDWLVDGYKTRMNGDRRIRTMHMRKSFNDADAMCKSIEKWVGNEFRSRVDELRVSPMSGVTNSDNAYVIVFKGYIYIFDEKHAANSLFGIVDEIGSQFKNDDEKDELLRKCESSMYDPSKLDYFMTILGKRYPYLITGAYSDGSLYLNKNGVYDVIHSKELDALCKDKRFMRTNIYYNYSLVRKARSEREDGINNASLPSVYYHGTTTYYAVNILKKGIRPKPENSIFKVPHEKTVFMTSSWDDATWYANMQCAHQKLSYGSSMCVLCIDPSKLDDNKFVMDYDIYNSHTEKKDDDVYNDIVSSNNLKTNNLSGLIRPNVDPRKFKRIGYRGIVMPSAITKVYVVDYLDRRKEYTRDEFMRTYGGKQHQTQTNA